MLLLKLKYPHKPLLLLTLVFVVIASFLLAWFFFGDIKYFFYDGLIVVGLGGLFELYLRIQHNIDTKYESLKAHLVLKEEFFSAQKETAIVLKNLALFLQKAEIAQKLEAIDQNTNKLEAKQEQTKKILIHEIQQNALHTAETNRADLVRVIDLIHTLGTNLKKSGNNTEQQILQAKEALEEIVKSIPEVDLSPLEQKLNRTEDSIKAIPTDFTALEQRLSDATGTIRSDIALIPQTDLSPFAQQLADTAAVLKQDIKQIDFSPLAQQLSDVAAIIRQDIELIPSTDLSPLEQQLSDVAAIIRQDIESLPQVDITLIDERLKVVQEELQGAIEAVPQTDLKPVLKRFELISSELKTLIKDLPNRDYQSLSHRFDLVDAEIQSLIQSGIASEEIDQLSEKIEAVESNLETQVKSIAEIEIDWTPLAQSMATLSKQIQHAQNISKAERQHVTNVFESLKNRLGRIQESILTLPESEENAEVTSFLIKLQEQTNQLNIHFESLQEKLEEAPHPKLEQYLAQNHEFQKGVVQVLETMEAEIQKQKNRKK